jgi:archaellum component FlaC
LIVQMENVYEDVEVHKKVKKHHGKNKGPKWFREFAERIEARLDKIETTLAEHTALLNQHSKDIAEIKVTLTEHSKRLDAIEARLDKIETRLDVVEARLDRNNIV